MGFNSDVKGLIGLNITLLLYLCFIHFLIDVTVSFQNFLRDLLKEAKKINDVSEDKLIEYTDTMVTIKLIIFLSSRQDVSDRMHLVKSVLTRAENRNKREQMSPVWLQCCVKNLVFVVYKALPDNKACRMINVTFSPPRILIILSVVCFNYSPPLPTDN
jgi:hypothetical protein